MTSVLSKLCVLSFPSAVKVHVYKHTDGCDNFIFDPRGTVELQWLEN